MLVPYRCAHFPCCCGVSIGVQFVPCFVKKNKLSGSKIGTDRWHLQKQSILGTFTFISSIDTALQIVCSTNSLFESQYYVYHCSVRLRMHACYYFSQRRGTRYCYSMSSSSLRWKALILFQLWCLLREPY